MDWADLSVNTIAPWSIVAAGALHVLRGKLVSKLTLDNAVQLMRDASKVQVELLQDQVGLMKDRLIDKDKVIAEGMAREDIQRQTILEQGSQIRVLVGVAESANRATLRVLPSARADVDEPS